MLHHRLFPTFFLLSAALAGCSGPLDMAERVPLEYTYIRIGQDQYSTGLHPEYEGSIAFPHCSKNPNPKDLTVQDGFEVYQQWGAPHAPGLRLVASHDSGPQFARANAGSLPPVGLIHNVLVNETLEGNSTDYTIHLWQQILNPEPIHREDRWFNLTFMPYGPGSTTYSEGTPC